MAWTEKYWIAGGLGAKDGSSEANAWDTAAAIAGVAPGHRVNMKASVDANTTTARTLATAGTTTAPISWRGYKSTIGDMDGAPTSTRVAGTDIPSITFTTAALTWSGAHQYFSNIDVAGARTAGPQVSISGVGIRAHRCRFANTAANSASSAVQVASSGIQWFTACWFSATATAARVFDASRRSIMTACSFEGGGVGYEPTSTLAESWLYRCVFLSNGSHGIRLGSVDSYLMADRCTFTACGGDGVRFDAIPSGLGLLADCIFRNCGGYGINNTTGTATNFIQRYNNSFYNNTSGMEFGLGDSPTFNDIIESSDPFATANNPALLAGALSRGAGSPGLFENESFKSYADVGALQHQDAGGGGGGVRRLTFGGGF